MIPSGHHEGHSHTFVAKLQRTVTHQATMRNHFSMLGCQDAKMMDIVSGVASQSSGPLHKGTQGKHTL